MDKNIYVEGCLSFVVCRSLLAYLPATDGMESIIFKRTEDF